MWLPEKNVSKGCMCVYIFVVVVVVVQSLSCVRLFATPWTAAQQTSLSFTISQSFCVYIYVYKGLPLVGSDSVVKNPPAMQEPQEVKV